MTNRDRHRSEDDRNWPGGAGWGRGHQGQGPPGSDRYGEGASAQTGHGGEARGYGTHAGREYLGFPEDHGRRGRGYASEGYGSSGDVRGWRERGGDQAWSFTHQREGGRGQPDHRGRGPRGYKRSDERVREDVCDQLYNDPYVDASDIEVEVSGGEVTLGGTIDSRQTRRRAEDIAESALGVTHVQNNLRVWRRDMPALGTHRATSGLGAAASGGTTFGARDAMTSAGDAAPAQDATALTAAPSDSELASRREAMDQGAAEQTRAPAVRTVAALFDTLGAANRAADHLAGIGIMDIAVAATEGDNTEVATAGPGGGVWEMLAGVLMPDEDRHAYAEGVRRGGVLLTAVVGEAMADEAVRVLGRAGAVDLDARSGEWRASGWQGRGLGGDTEPGPDTGLDNPVEPPGHAPEPDPVGSEASRAERT
jgi:osmotically-inducible protein OsmY